MCSECDKCHGKISNGICPCGEWYESKDMPDFANDFEKAIVSYNRICDFESPRAVFTGDHHSGTCIVMFKGTYEDVEKVRQFIESL